MDSPRNYRFKSNPQEKIMYDIWKQDHVSMTHKSHSTLEYLLAEEPNVPKGECSDRDEQVSSIVIQWLGSPVGLLFLKKCGFEEIKND